MIARDRPLTPRSGDLSRVLTPIELKIVGKESSDGKDKNDAVNFAGVSIKNLDKKYIKDGNEDDWGDSG